ncbi:MAG: zf-TFIIB domain-containing protein [Burkholderiales bacterium]|nr:zf-TFIIB domain-containing protein [Burkholderiales bacterium]MBK9344966.1 zf-TFIIB domain-containing protein [Burkholderiales bacterium]
MPSSPAPSCPSCRSAMQVHALPGNHGKPVELDLCFACQGMWIDPQENLKLSPAAVADLFKLLHEQRAAGHLPLAAKVHCPRCTGPLTQGFDVVRSGRYITYRCAKGHGRFSAFSSFMIEKGFVRLLTPAEINDIAQRVTVIHCNSCGAPVDLKKGHACVHCRSPLSLLDPTAVEKALQGYAHAVKATAPSAPAAVGVADALIMLERDRQRALREPGAQRSALLTSDASSNIDLWSIGIALVAAVLN